MDNSDDPRKTPYYYYVGGLIYEWHGGAYIDVNVPDGDDLAAIDTLNVWDYGTDQPTIPRTREAFLGEVADHYAYHAAVGHGPFYWHRGLPYLTEGGWATVATQTWAPLTVRP